VVNQALARRFWRGGDAVGRRLGIVEGGGGAVTWRRIVGVAPDLQYEEFGEETAQSRLNVFVPYATRPYRGLALMVRTRGEPRAQADVVRLALREQEPTVATFDVRTMDEVRVATTWEQRLFGHMMAGFAGLALALACLGVYGVLSYGVAQRLHEFGIRMALGARRVDLLGSVVRHGAGLALGGLVLGALLAAALTRLLQSILYGVEAFDLPAFAGMAALLFAVVLLASALPARRAAGLDPMAVLRAE
jgi:putative ABC transport system permease protein